MLGFFIGLASLFGLVHVLRRDYGHHPQHHHHGGCGPRGRHRRGRRFGKRWMRGLFERLDTTPGQEKVIRQALEDVMDEAGRARRAVPTMRSSIGAAFGSETLEESALEEAMAPADEGLARVRESLKGALGRIHEVLDDQQRQTLARWLSREGSRFPMAFGPYR